MDEIFGEIRKEREKQDEKWRGQNWPFTWLSILGEEVGEANKHALEAHFKLPGGDPDYSKYREKLIQVAAVAVAMIKCHDRHRNRMETLEKNRREEI